MNWLNCLLCKKIVLTICAPHDASSGDSRGHPTMSPRDVAATRPRTIHAGTPRRRRNASPQPVQTPRRNRRRRDASKPQSYDDDDRPKETCARDKTPFLYRRIIRSGTVIATDPSSLAAPWHLRRTQGVVASSRHRSRAAGGTCPGNAPRDWTLRRAATTLPGTGKRATLWTCGEETWNRISPNSSCHSGCSFVKNGVYWPP